MANQAVLEKVLADEAFVKTLVDMQTPEEVRDALNARGAEITVEEAKAFVKVLRPQAEGELDEDALEDVAGGYGLSLGDIFNALQAMKEYEKYKQNHP